MNTLLQTQDISQNILILMETNAREARLCIQILAANIGKPDPCSILDRFATAYRSACMVNESLTEEICRTYFAHIENKDIETLVKALNQITQAARSFSRKSLLLISHIDDDELSMQAGLLNQISDTVTEMVLTFSRHDALDSMITQRRSLKLLEDEADKLIQDRISRTLKKNNGPLKTIATLSLCNSMRELIDTCLNAGHSAFELHLRYA